MTYILSIDQGTTSSRAMIFNKDASVKSTHQIEFTQYFPNNGWVEHDANEIWSTTLQCCRQAMAKAGLFARDIAAIGISNQRETTIIWDKESGQPIHKAIVWQDRRTSELCLSLKKDKALSNMVSQKTGLLLDPYFSATKIAWLLDNVDGARARADKGELLFGTIETFLLWHLTNGKKHLTDASNASRTLLFNIHTQSWDEELLRLFNIPESLLATVVDNVGDFGATDPRLFGESIAITGMAGDQQAATIGQACFEPGMSKCTYGTGCFMLLNTGDKALTSKNQLLTTVAYRLNGKVTYGIEGSIFIAGAAIKWLRDGVHMLETAAESEQMALSVPDTNGVYLVSAFAGLGAPYWNPEARGAILGLTRDTQTAHIVRAGLESVCYRTKDLMVAMQEDGACLPQNLRVDGGMVANNWILQFLSDILDVRVDRPRCIETSALGAAYLAGLGAGVYESLDEIAAHWSCDTSFSPSMPEEKREGYYDGWKQAVACINH
jgi:glycerol kinase